MASHITYSAFRAWFAANFAGIRQSWDNETFNPGQPTAYPAPPNQWIKVEFSDNVFSQQSIGSGSPDLERWTETGDILVHSIIQAGAGSLAARTTATEIALALRGLQLAPDITLFDLSIGDAGIADDDGKWWSLTLRATWRRG